VEGSEGKNLYRSILMNNRAPVSTLEHLSSAFQSGNLSLKEPTGDLDYIIALGQTVMSVNKAASALLHLHLALDRSAYESARVAAVNIVRRMAVKRGMNLSVKEIKRIGEAALKYHICPVCPVCYGRRYQTAPGTPMLTSKTCLKCRGTGLKPYPIHRHRLLAEAVARLETIEWVTEQAVRNKMRRE
jgi:hypothetical protein